VTGPAHQTLHASCVAVSGRGLLILGPSGSGKSALALRMLALGATLVADDRTDLTSTVSGLVAASPSAIRGMIEARGIGILVSPALDSVVVSLAIDLAQPEDQRLPPFRKITILGCEIDLVLHPQNPHFPEALMLYLSHGRHA
jgi:HPr kinase/phosphorylase